MLWRSSLGSLVPSAGGLRHQQLQARRPYVTQQEVSGGGRRP